jgi:hypothetical protein
VIKICVEPGFKLILVMPNSPVFECTQKYRSYKQTVREAQLLQQQMWEEALCTWDNIQVWDNTRTQPNRLFIKRDSDGRKQ